jgi:UDP-3-O-[3-hydroxymyristoyl] glucosamine N-acyltransferase
MYSIKELADLIGGQISGDESLNVKGLAPFDVAESDELTFAADEKYFKKLHETDAAVVIIPPLVNVPEDKTYIRVYKSPRELMPIILKFFEKETRPVEKPIEDSAKLHETVKLAPHVYIGHDVVIEEGTVLYPNVTILEGVKIGKNCIIQPGVVIREFCEIGNNVIIQPGAVIGSDGFGYVKIEGENVKIDQIGTVVVEDNVEIGGNCSIDRGTIGKTIIKKGTKLDNLVHIAHNVVIGEQGLITAQAGIAGSAIIGKNIMTGGQVGIAGHITIGDNVILAGKAGVTSNTKGDQKLSGYPAINYNDDLKAKIAFKKLPSLIKRVAKLEKLLKSRGEEK